MFSRFFSVYIHKSIMINCTEEQPHAAFQPVFLHRNNCLIPTFSPVVFRPLFHIPGVGNGDFSGVFQALFCLSCCKFLFVKILTQHTHAHFSFSLSRYMVGYLLFKKDGVTESTPSFIFLIIRLSLRLCIQDTAQDLICQAVPDSHPSLH